MTSAAPPPLQGTPPVNGEWVGGFGAPEVVRREADFALLE